MFSFGVGAEPVGTSETTNLKSFHFLENGDVAFSILDTIKTTKKLDSGYYSIYVTDSFSNPELKVKKEVITENNELIEYNFIDKIRNIYNKFFDPKIKEEVAKLGYKHKLGLLLHGKQGGGKSSILKHFFSDAIEKHDAIVFTFTTMNKLYQLWDFICQVRKIQNNPIIIYLDEFDQAVYNRSEDREDFFKKIMDGHLAIDNCMFLMATNYVDRLPKTITERPSRVKYVFEVEGIQEENLIKKYMETSYAKLGKPCPEFDYKELKGSTIDELKEVVLDNVMNIEGSDKPITKVIGFRSNSSSTSSSTGSGIPDPLRGLMNR